ncbi:MAG: molybdenum cofactor biosynthesis protein MoaE [Alphaproteobacteria bacterium]
MSDFIHIQREDFDAGAETAALEEDAGAIATFVGLVRAEDGITSLTLEHYPGMTQREIAAHVAEARERWLLKAVRVIHRVGELKPGERIVFVGASAAHRKDAFAAVEFLMDYLKTRAPFWKEEERGAGKVWVEAKPEDETRASRWR